MTSASLLTAPTLAADEPTSLVTAPLAYGYLRVPGDVPDHEVKALEDQVMDYAGQLGCTFAGFFFEFRSGMATAFNDLIEELRRTRALYVIVPSLRHVAYHRLLREVRLSRLESDTGVEVLELSALVEA